MWSIQAGAAVAGQCVHGKQCDYANALAVQPTLVQYADYDSFWICCRMLATTGNDLDAALVVTDVNGNATSLATLNVYKNNGGTQAGNGDIVAGRQYFLTYVDSLNSNAGGFVLR